MKKLTRRHLFAILLLSLALATPARAMMDRKLEPRYAEALLQYRSRNYDQAITALDTLLAEAPDTREFLELKALSLKGRGDLRGAMAIYQKLMHIVPFTERAPYEFELGVVYFKQNDYTQAKHYLSRAIRSHFNEQACHYLLGVLSYTESDWKAAKRHLTLAASGKAASLRAESRMYLGELYAELGDVGESMRDLASARDLAEQEIAHAPTDESTIVSYHQVIDNSNHTILTLNRAGWNKDIGLSTGYNSNVLLEPSNGGTSPTGATGDSSGVGTLFWDLGYATAPAEAYQLLAFYRGNINYNSNQQTRTGEFFSHDLLAEFNLNPVGTTSLGTKVEATYLLRVAQDGTSNAGRFSSYSLVGTVGPFIREEIAPKSYVGAEADFVPEKYYSDANTDPSYAQTGWAGSAQIYWQRADVVNFFNPKIALSYQYNRTNGSEYRSRGATLELSSGMSFSQSVTLIPSISGGFYAYPDRPEGYRRDTILTAGATLNYLATPAFLLAPALQYTDNMSNITDIYQYTGLIAAINATYYF